jgi:hypothetical protein
MLSDQNNTKGELLSYWGFGQAGGIFSTIGFSIELGLAFIHVLVSDEKS